MNEEIEAKIKAQAKLQQDNNYPDFAPLDGFCYKCKSQIYERITLKKAKTELITGCPYCLYSYCE